MGKDESAKRVAAVMFVLWLCSLLCCSIVAASASSWWTYNLMSGDIRQLRADLEAIRK